MEKTPAAKAGAKEEVGKNFERHSDAAGSSSGFSDVDTGQR